MAKIRACSLPDDAGAIGVGRRASPVTTGRAPGTVAGTTGRRRPGLAGLSPGCEGARVPLQGRAPRLLVALAPALLGLDVAVLGLKK